MLSFFQKGDPKPDWVSGVPERAAVRGAGFSSRSARRGEDSSPGPAAPSAREAVGGVGRKQPPEVRGTRQTRVPGNDPDQGPFLPARPVPLAACHLLFPVLPPRRQRKLDQNPGWSCTEAPDQLL